MKIGVGSHRNGSLLGVEQLREACEAASLHRRLGRGS